MREDNITEERDRFVNVTDKELEDWREDRRLYKDEQQRSLACRQDPTGGAEYGAWRTRLWLRGRGYLAVQKHTDLQPYGYQIIAWYTPVMPDEPMVYEYAPVDHGGWIHAREVPRRRMTANSIEEQQAIHKLLRVTDDAVCFTQLDLFAGGA